MDRSWCRVPTKASVLKFSAFFIVQISHPYMTTGKTIDLTRQTFVGKVMFLLFNMLSRLVIYADDITLMAESEEELKSLLMKVKERVKRLA